MFLYSQDLSNYKIYVVALFSLIQFLYSQDLNNYAVNGVFLFLFSQGLGNFEGQSIGLNLQCFFFPTYAIIILNREGFHDWRREYEEKTVTSISAVCIGACGM